VVKVFPYFSLDPTQKVWPTISLEQHMQVKANLVKTAYEEKVYFFLPNAVGKVFIKIFGYKPSDLTLMHYHGVHKHALGLTRSYPAPEACGYACNYWFSKCVSDTAVGSGTEPQDPAFPDGLKVRVNGIAESETTPIGDGTSDVESDWIDITDFITKGATNYFELLATTPGCMATIQIKYGAE